MFNVKFCKTICVPTDLKVQLDEFLQAYPTQTLHAAMVKSMRLGLPLLIKKTAKQEAYAVDR